MKKLITITFILLSVNINAQDISFMTSINKTTTEFAQVLSDSIVSLSNTHYKLLKTTERANNYRFIYIPSTITKKQFTAQRNYDNALVIDFMVIEKEPGIKTLKLSRIKADYSVIFPTWKKYFKSDANIETTPTNYSSQKYDTENFTFIFRKGVGFNNNVWTISNQS